MSNIRKYPRCRHRLVVLLAGLGLMIGVAEGHGDHDGQEPLTVATGSDARTQDRAALAARLDSPRYSVSEQHYAIPKDITLLDEEGSEVLLESILAADEPLALNFVFTTCSTICPVMTASFSQMRRMLGDRGEALRLVSISIDPQYDRPETLKRYSEHFGAGSGWTFLTGDSNTIVEVLRAFDSFTGSKMNHRPVSYFRKSQGDNWIRIDGLASGADLAREAEARLLK